LQEGSYQQQSYRSEVVVLGSFFFAFSILFVIMNTSYSTLTTKRKKSRLKGNESAIQILGSPAFRGIRHQALPRQGITSPWVSKRLFLKPSEIAERAD
jgi:hypothetical protein